MKKPKNWSIAEKERKHNFNRDLTTNPMNAMVDNFIFTNKITILVKRGCLQCSLGSTEQQNYTM